MMASNEWSMGERFRGRFWNWVGGNLLRHGALPQGGAQARWESAAGRKLTEYMIRWAYYENKRLYHALSEMGLIAASMPTEWNPAPAVVAFYQANTLGRGLSIAAEQEARQEAVAAAVSQVWRWSNFGRLTEKLVETAAVLSDSFVKVAEKTDEDERVGAVYLQEIPPETVAAPSLVTDERGFVTAIRIDTPRRVSVFSGEERRHVLVEYWRKDWGAGEGGVRFYEVGVEGEIDDERLGDPVREQTFEELGYDFIPVVYANTPAHWWGLTDQIDRYNALGATIASLNRPVMLVQGRQTDSEGRPVAPPLIKVAGRMVDPTTPPNVTAEEVAGGAAMLIRVPSQWELSYAQSPIDFATALRKQEQVREGVIDALPEYRVATLDATNVATETLQVLFGMAGERVLSMREKLEEGLARAQQMALTMGQLAGLAGFEAEAIGTWEDGGIRHSFVERDVFTPTAGMVAAAYQQFVAGQLPPKLALIAANADQALIDAYEEEAAAQALRERTTLAAQLVRQRALVDQGAADNGATRL